MSLAMPMSGLALRPFLCKAEAGDGKIMERHLMVRAFNIFALAILVGASALLPSLALAHTGEGVAGGFISGLAHPILGADHIVAMVAVGL